MIMERINEPGDLQKLNLTKEELDELAQEIREVLQGGIWLLIWVQLS